MQNWERLPTESNEKTEVHTKKSNSSHTSGVWVCSVMGSHLIIEEKGPHIYSTGLHLEKFIQYISNFKKRKNLIR